MKDILAKLAAIEGTQKKNLNEDLESRNRASMRSAQSAWDNMEPPEDYEPEYEECPECGGSGLVDDGDGPQTCEHCEGEGAVISEIPYDDDPGYDGDDYYDESVVHEAVSADDKAKKIALKNAARNEQKMKKDNAKAQEKMQKKMSTGKNASSISEGIDEAGQVEEGTWKDIKRLATGKDIKSRISQEIGKSQEASMRGDHKTSKKHFDRYDKLDKLANKGSMTEAGPPGKQSYPNTEQGLLQYVEWAYDKSFIKKLDLPTAEIQRDPEVDGVWAIDSPRTGFRCIIYLKDGDNEEGSVPMSRAKRWVENGKVTLKDLKVWIKNGNLNPNKYKELAQYSPDYDMFESNNDDERDERRDARVPADEPEYKWDGKNNMKPAMHNGRRPAPVKEGDSGWDEEDEPGWNDTYDEGPDPDLHRNEEFDEAYEQDDDDYGFGFTSGMTEKEREEQDRRDERDADRRGGYGKGLEEQAKWRQQTNRPTGPGLGKTFVKTVTDYGDRVMKEPIGRDGLDDNSEPIEKQDKLAQRKDAKFALSTKGLKLTKKNAQRNLKNNLKSTVGTHGKSNVPEGFQQDIGEARRPMQYTLQVVEYVKLDPRSGIATADGYLYDDNDEEMSVELEIDYSLPERDSDSGPGSDIWTQIIKITDENGFDIPVEDVSFDEDVLNNAIYDAAAEARLPYEEAFDPEMDEAIVPTLAAAAIGHAIQGDHGSASAQNAHRNMQRAAIYAKAPNGGKMPQFKVPTRTGGAKTTIDKFGGITQCAGNCAEGQTMRKYKVIAESVSFNVSDPHLAKVLRRFPHEVAVFNTEGELDDHLYDALYDHYCDAGEMPYGTMKARDGDPYQWVGDQLAKDLGVNPFHGVEEGMGGDVVDEMTTAQRSRAYGMSSGKDSAAKDAMWAAAKAKAEGGNGSGNPFAAKTPAMTNPAFGGSGERASQAIAGAGAWSGNFESVGDDDEEQTYDADGNLSPGGAYDAGGHYDAERGADAADYYRDSMDEDSLDPTDPTKDTLVEGLEGVITDVLTKVGLDHGLDFFFENGLVVIGSREARIAYHALNSDSRITAYPEVKHVDGEEFRIEFSNADEDEIDEAMTDVQKWRMAQLAGDTHQTGSTQLELDRQYADSMKNGDTQTAAVIKKRMQQLAAQRLKSKATDTSSMQFASKQNKGKPITEDVNLSLNAEGDDVLTLLKTLSGIKSDEMPAVDSMEPITPMGSPAPMDDGPMGMSSLISKMDDLSSPEPEAEIEVIDGNDGADSGDGFEDGIEHEEMDEGNFANSVDEPQQPQVYATTAQQMNFGDKSRQGRRQPMTQPGNNPMAETRNLMRQYETMLRDIKAK